MGVALSELVVIRNISFHWPARPILFFDLAISLLAILAISQAAAILNFLICICCLYMDKIQFLEAISENPEIWYARVFVRVSHRKKVSDCMQK